MNFNISVLLNRKINIWNTWCKIANYKGLEEILHFKMDILVNEVVGFQSSFKKNPHIVLCLVVHKFLVNVLIEIFFISIEKLSWMVPFYLVCIKIQYSGIKIPFDCLTKCINSIVTLKIDFIKELFCQKITW